MLKTESVTYFSEKDEEFANILIGIGTNKNVAKVLVFLANVPETTSCEIERGADLRQPEVSLALQHMIEKDWIISRESTAERKGRPIKI